MSATPTPVHHDQAGRRFVIETAGATAQLAYRRPDPHTIEYFHTFVPPALRRRGFGEALARHALAYAEAEGLEVIPTCWFVRRVMGRPPEESGPACVL